MKIRLHGYILKDSRCHPSEAGVKKQQRLSSYMAISVFPVGHKCQYARMLKHQDVRISILCQVACVISISKATRFPKGLQQWWY